MRAGGRTRYRLVGVASLAAGWIAVVTQGGRLRRERTRGHTTTTNARRAGEELERRARRAHVGTHSSLVTPTPCPQRIPIHTPSREERLHAAPRTTEGDRRTQRRLRRVRLLELRACGAATCNERLRRCSCNVPLSAFGAALRLAINQQAGVHTPPSESK